MSITPSDLTQIVDNLQSFGNLIPASELDSISRVVLTLLGPQTPETVDTQIQVATQASAVIGYLESRWRGVERSHKILLESIRANSAKMFREGRSIGGGKTTEAQVLEALALDERVVNSESHLSTLTTIGDILESLRYAIKNRFDGLLELSRNERQTSRSG